MRVLARAARAEGPEVQAVPAWRIALSGVLSLLGLGLSTYLTVAHFVGAGILECAGNGVINCTKVTTSPQSYVFGIPVAVLGLGYWVVMTALNSPWAWRSADRRIHVARLTLSVLGIGFVLYLLSAELLIIGAICIYCTGVHIVTFAQLVLVMATVPAMLGWGRAPTAGAARRR
jgi:uncharacterized membrane protein